MDLLPTGEQQQIIDSAASYLSSELPLQRLKALDCSIEVPDASAWKQVAELGWFGLGLDESVGGVGFGPSEEVLLLREMGRVAASPRMLFAIVAAHVAAAAGDLALAGRLASGEVMAAYAVVRARHSGEAPVYRIYEWAQSQVVLSFDGDKALIHDLSGVKIEAIPCIDTAISMGEISLDALQLLAEKQDAVLEARGALLLAAYEIGLSERALAMIVDYAKIRQTFGRPIGAYQAVRHPCANMATSTEQAKVQVFFASVTLADGWPDAATYISAARVLSEQAARQGVDDNIQLHGGIGVTEEFDAHLLMKRAAVARQWFGDRRVHLGRVLNAPMKLEVVS